MSFLYTVEVVQRSLLDHTHYVVGIYIIIEGILVYIGLTRNLVLETVGKCNKNIGDTIGETRDIF